jgi:hypothetical protein
MRSGVSHKKQPPEMSKTGGQNPQVKYILRSLAHLPVESNQVAPYVGWRTERPGEQPDAASRPRHEFVRDGSA